MKIGFMIIFFLHFEMIDFIYMNVTTILKNNIT